MRAFTQMWDRICARALRRHRREAAPLPLRRAGELARAHRGAAREQRAAHRARDARRDAVEGRAGPGGAAAVLERGARAADARGTSSGRCGSSRCSRTSPTCSSTTTCSTARRSSRPRSPSSSRPREAELAVGARRRRRVRDDRRDEGPARAEPRRAGAPHRVGRARRSSASTRSPRPSRRRSPTSAQRERHRRRSIPRSSASRSSAIEQWRAAARRRPRSTAALDAAATRSRRPPRTSCPRRSTLARAGGTVGEWAGALREVFGEYRAPTGVGAVAAAPGDEHGSGARRGPGRGRASSAARSGSSSASPGSTVTPTAPSRSRSRRATPGMEVVYQGIRLTPARDRGRGPRRGRRRRRPLDPLGLAPRAGARDHPAACATDGVDAPVVVGGIIPDADRERLEAVGVARVYTPKDFRLAAIMADIAELGIEHRRGTASATAAPAGVGS